MITTIRLTKETKEELDKFKAHPRETMEQVLIRMIKYLNNENLKGGSE